MKPLIADSLVFEHTLWTSSQVNRLTTQAFEELKNQCQIEVIDSKFIKANLSEYDAEVEFERELNIITEETLEIIGHKTEKDYEKRGIAILFLDTNGSVDGTLGEANTGKRQVTIFFHDFSPLITQDYSLAQAHREDSKYNVVLHELVHLLSQDFEHPDAEDNHILHEDTDKRSNHILDNHCLSIRNSPLLYLSN